MDRIHDYLYTDIPWNSPPSTVAVRHGIKFLAQLGIWLAPLPTGVLLAVQHPTFGRNCTDSTFGILLVAGKIHSLESRPCELRFYRATGTAGAYGDCSKLGSRDSYA